MTTPTRVIIFGATGDLVSKKVFPALLSLHNSANLNDTSIIGLSRRPWGDDQFREHVKNILGQDTDNEFLGKTIYSQIHFDEPEDYQLLAQRLAKMDEESGICANKLYYLAVPPEHYDKIFDNLANSGLAAGCGNSEGWTRILVEKPFGKDLPTARALDKKLGELFKEEQIYRVDHYLGKEMLQNILVFRFSNNLLEDSWNNKYVQSITIRFLETGNVGNRGAFYDGVGALRDVGQNHLLQMLALTTMDAPSALTPSAIRESRKNILSALATPIKEKAPTNTYRAQYKGYKSEDGVAQDSQTETYFKLVTHLDTPRWHGVPIILEAGKAMHTQSKEIIIDFKHPSPCFCPPGAHEEYKNKIVITLEPEEKIDIDIWAKKPGLKLDFMKKNFSLPYNSEEETPADAYEKLLLDALEGDQTLFVTTKEVQSMWAFVDPIMAAWQENLVPLAEYDQGTDTPHQKSMNLEEKSAYGLFPPSTGKEFKKEIGIIGLGKMGGNMSRNLLDHGWKVAGFNKSDDETRELEKAGLSPAFSIQELVQGLAPPRIVWVMVPAGPPVTETISELKDILEKGDTVINGGNSFYKDSQNHHKILSEKGINFLDVGVSGGQSGARYGACLMVGGSKDIYESLTPLFTDLSAPGGYAFFEGPGAGHFVKMVHNGIEYGMMQSIAEGFAVLKASSYNINLLEASRVYNASSIIESRLIGWLGSGYHEYGTELKEIDGKIAHTGEGEWTVQTARELGIPVPVIEKSFQFRLDSDNNPSYTGQVVMVLRNQFGGHSIKKDK